MCTAVYESLFTGYKHTKHGSCATALLNQAALSAANIFFLQSLNERQEALQLWQLIKKLYPVMPLCCRPEVCR